MGAELVIDALMGTFAEQVEVEVGQDRGKTVGILELDDVVAEPCAELVVLGAVWQGADEQPGIVDTVQRCNLAMFADRFDFGGLGPR